MRRCGLLRRRGGPFSGGSEGLEVVLYLEDKVGQREILASTVGEATLKMWAPL